MATIEQRKALLAVVCPWCRAAVGERCSVRASGSQDTAGGSRRGPARPVIAFDAGAHDARWQAALGLAAPVNVEVLSEVHGRAVGVTP